MVKVSLIILKEIKHNHKKKKPARNICSPRMYYTIKFNKEGRGDAHKREKRKKKKKDKDNGNIMLRKERKRKSVRRTSFLQAYFGRKSSGKNP